MEKKYSNNFILTLKKYTIINFKRNKKKITWDF